MSSSSFPMSIVLWRCCLLSFLFFLALVACSASASFCCTSSVETMILPFKIIHFPDNRSLRLLINCFSSVFSCRRIVFSAWRCSATPLNRRACFRIGVASAACETASLKRALEVRKNVPSGGELVTSRSGVGFAFRGGVNDVVGLQESKPRILLTFVGNKPAPLQPL